jgi:competence protein ComEC
MHALAVSGLHVGIVYGLLLFLLKPLQRLKRGDWILAVVSIIVLWVYGFITGLSPSVLRAVTMFSFVALAKPGAYRANLYNTLAASAFCILLYDPFLLMSVGFQLSYMAVVGIVYLQSGLYNLWEPANRIVDEIWKVSCVSIAAQIATFTIGLLYFHQFPNYFLLSNLFVIPGSFVVLIAGIALLALDFVTPIAIGLGFLVEWIIKILNVIVFSIEQFPFSLIENIYITPWQCMVLIGALIAIIFLIERRNFKWLALASTFLLLFSIGQWQHFRNDVHIDKLAIYNVRGHTAIDMIDHGQTFFFADSGLLKDDSKIQYHIAPHRIKAGVNEAIFPANAFYRSLPGCTLMTWKGKTFLRIFDKNFRLPTGWQVDYVIVSNNAFTNWFELKNQIQLEKIIFDSSNSTYYVSKALEQMKDNSSKVYSVIHEGAFELLI